MYLLVAHRWQPYGMAALHVGAAASMHGASFRGADRPRPSRPQGVVHIISDNPYIRRAALSSKHQRADGRRGATTHGPSLMVQSGRHVARTGRCHVAKAGDAASWQSGKGWTLPRGAGYAVPRGGESAAGGSGALGAAMAYAFVRTCVASLARSASHLSGWIILHTCQT